VVAPLVDASVFGAVAAVAAVAAFAAAEVSSFGLLPAQAASRFNNTTLIIIFFIAIPLILKLI
jgi:hypothetical protein